MHAIDRVLAYVSSVPWAIHRDRGAAIVDVLARRAVAGPLPPAAVDALVGADVADVAARRDTAQRATAAAGGVVAVLPVYGVILHRAYQVEQVSARGDVSSERLVQQLRAFDADPDVRAILLDIDSPGGEVPGTQELGNAIASLTKPVVAAANGTAASAAYWLASQADEIVVTPSGEVGSIGVWNMHIDISAALARRGEVVTLIRAGRYKVEGHPFGPLEDDARAEMQRSVDEAYTAFVKAVARGRGVSVKVVRGEFGEGRMVSADEAVRRGMADRVATFQETLDRLVAGGRVKKRERAQADEEPTLSAEAAAELELRERELDVG